MRNGTIVPTRFNAGMIDRRPNVPKRKCIKAYLALGFTVHPHGIAEQLTSWQLPEEGQVGLKISKVANDESFRSTGLWHLGFHREFQDDGRYTM